MTIFAALLQIKINNQTKQQYDEIRAYERGGGSPVGGPPLCGQRQIREIRGQLSVVGRDVINKKPREDALYQKKDVFLHRNSRFGNGYFGS